MHSPSLIAALALLAGGCLASSAAMAASPAWTPPRAADGHPDLEGLWTNASLTRLIRSSATAPLVVSEDKAQAIAKTMTGGQDADRAPTDPAKGAPPVGGDTAIGFNSFWLEGGHSLARVKGEFRSSWIVDPADGQLPLSVEGRRRVAQAAEFARAADTPTAPEALEPWDRCLISSRGSGGPGMLNNIYNSNYQIVQTPGAVAIVVEMIHDVRNIPIFPDKAAAQAGHGPATVQRWLGDSVGWWEGGALVVETTNVKAEQGRAGPIFLTPQGKVVERFSRMSKGQILYSFEVEDPTYYSRPWRAEMPLNARPDRLYEYACHEANYAMRNLLNAAHVAAAVKNAPRTGSAQR